MEVQVGDYSSSASNKPGKIMEDEQEGWIEEVGRRPK